MTFAKQSGTKPIVRVIRVINHLHIVGAITISMSPVDIDLLFVILCTTLLLCIVTQIFCPWKSSNLNNLNGNNLKHENEAEWPWLFSLVFVFKIISTFIGQNPKLFFMHVLKKDVLLL